jgi:hypothetical protein
MKLLSKSNWEILIIFALFFALFSMIVFLLNLEVLEELIKAWVIAVTSSFSVLRINQSRNKPNN